MKSKLFFKHIKHNILRYTVGFSAAVHLIGIFMFPSWGMVPDLTKAKVIKIKTVVQKPVEKIPPEPEKKKEPELVKPEPEPEPITPKIRQKTLRVKSVKSVTPAPAEKRIPVPIHSSKHEFKPVKAIQRSASIPQPVANLKILAELKISSAIPPSPRRKQTEESPSMLFNALKEHKPGETFLNIAQIGISGPASKVANSPETSSPHPAILKKQFSHETMIAGSRTPRVTFASSRGKISGDPNPIIQPHRIQSRDPGMALVPAKKVNFASTIVSIPEAGIGVRSPQDLNFIPSTHSQRIVSARGAYSPLTYRTTALMQMASIPSQFSEEPIIGSNETSGNKFSGNNKSTGGTKGNSADQMGQIRKAFSSQVWSKIAQSKYYPRLARKRGFEGEPVVAFTLGNTGDLIEASINNPSPYKMLDQAALDAVKSASPYPPIPELLKIKTIRFKLPISFILEGP